MKKRLSIEKINNIKNSVYKTGYVMYINYIQFLTNEIRQNYFLGLNTGKNKQSIYLQNTIKGEPIKILFSQYNPTILTGYILKKYANEYRLAKIYYKKKIFVKK
jgi:hypothetical protein